MQFFCPCSSGEEYEECCKPFHEGVLPKNALLLMRSRYAAYALNLPDYIIATTHPLNPQYQENKLSWRRSISQFSKETTFHKLEIHDFHEEGNRSIVTFTAYIEQKGKDATFKEKSLFEKVDQRWLYVGVL